MARVTFGPLINDARGKQGTTIFFRNRGGSVSRAWLKPTNHQTTLQQFFRAWTKQAGQLWNQTLTEQQRVAWNAAALNITRTNKLGHQNTEVGIDLMVQRNKLALIAGGTTILNPPVDVVPIGPGLLALAADSVSQTLTLTPTTALPAGYGIIIRATKMLSPGIYNFAKDLRSLIVAPGPVASGFGTGTAPVPPFTAGNQYTPADWAVSGGTLTITPSLTHEDIYNATNLADSVATSTITLPNATDLYLSLTARVNTTTGAAYLIQFAPAYNFWGIYYRPAWAIGGFITINTTAYSSWTSAPKPLVFSVVGTLLTATYDTTSVISSNDTRLSSGCCGMAAYAPSYSYQAWSLSQPTLVMPTLAGLTATYLLKYGPLVAGKKIGVDLSYVNLTTGQRLPPQAAITTIT